MNKILIERLPKHISLVSNENINVNHLNGSRVHLNRQGVVALAYNFISFMKVLHSNRHVFENKLAEPSIGGDESNGLVKQKQKLIGGGLKVCCLNINSLLKHIDEVKIFCETHRPHVLCLNETKLSNEINDKDIQIENYHTILRKDRNRHSGGVAIYVTDTIKLKKREDLQTQIESITVELDILFVKPILITTVYRLPDSLVEIFDKLESPLSRLDNENKELIFSGDMNCNWLNSQDNDTKHMKRIYNTPGHKQLAENATRTTTDTTGFLPNY